MARRRMFTVELIDSDRFTELSIPVQMLYVYMSLHADDEGFVSSGKRMARLYGCPEGLQALEDSGFIIRFPSGVLVITDWYLNNTIRRDRTKDTIYTAERAQLTVQDGKYVLLQGKCDDNRLATNCQPDDNRLTTSCQPNDNRLTTQNRIEQNRVEQNRIEQNRPDQIIIEDNSPRAEAAPGGEDGEKAPVKNPDFTQFIGYCEEKGLNRLDRMEFWSHYTLNGWRDKDGRPIKDWKSLAAAWDRRDRSQDAFAPYPLDNTS